MELNVGRQGQEPRDAGPCSASRPRLRILHFGFEDPMMPGAGGGSVRTHEINKRIAARGHSVVVLTTRYPGWAARIQDGVQYFPVGFGTGRTKVTRLLGYCIRLPWEAWKRHGEADLVVEDFFAPFSSMGAPLWAGRPTVGMVQWLHAHDKFREYKLPFHWLERAGVRRHSNLIAVSHGTAQRLAELNPTADVRVIGNGVDSRAMDVRPQLGNDVLYMGRLEYAGKGLDLLLAAWEAASKIIDGNLIIAGAGPDERKIRADIVNRNLGDRVRLVGWISGRQKFEALAAARLVVVPSRAETFGLAAVEALATGTPVVAFDIPCLREVVPPGSGWLVPPFETATFAEEIAKRYLNLGGISAAGQAGRQFAALFNWDSLAADQLEVYRAAAAGIPVRNNQGVSGQ